MAAIVGIVPADVLRRRAKESAERATRHREDADRSMRYSEFMTERADEEDAFAEACRKAADKLSLTEEVSNA